MEKSGWWSVKFELTVDGEEVRWDDLDECTQEHIAEAIKEGYSSGEICMEMDDSGSECEWNGNCLNCIYRDECEKNNT